MNDLLLSVRRHLRQVLEVQVMGDTTISLVMAILAIGLPVAFIGYTVYQVVKLIKFMAVSPAAAGKTSTHVGLQVMLVIGGIVMTFVMVRFALPLGIVGLKLLLTGTAM